MSTCSASRQNQYQGFTRGQKVVKGKYGGSRCTVNILKIFEHSEHVFDFAKMLYPPIIQFSKYFYEIATNILSFWYLPLL